MRRKKALGTTIQNFTRLFHGADRGVKRYPHHLEDLAAISLAFTGYSKPFSVLPLFAFKLPSRFFFDVNFKSFPKSQFLII
jgi:hypothetical protein